MHPRLNLFSIVKTVSALVLLALVLSACEKKEPVRIGFVGGLSGRVADLGLAGRNGAILAIEERNSKGGVRGRTIELLIEDDRQEPEVARAAVKRLLDQKVSAIIGHMTSAMSMVTVPIVSGQQIVMISPTTTTTHLSKLDDYFFRVIGTTNDYAKHGARFFYEELNVRQATVIYDLNNKSYSVSYFNSFREPFKKMGGTILKSQAFKSGTDISYLSLIDKTMTPETEGVLIISSALDAALLCQQIRKTKPDIPIIISEWSATEKFINMGGSAVEGVYAHQYFDRDSKDVEYQEFRRVYIKRFGEEPGFASVGGYDAANVILDALQKNPERIRLKETILSIKTFSGIQGDVTFDKYGDTTRKTHLSVIHNGKFVVQD